jgi:hypothetical protein
MKSKEQAKKILKYHTDLHGDMGKHYALKSTEQKKYASEYREQSKWNEVINQIEKL